jgi:hypothetical protein
MLKRPAIQKVAGRFGLQNSLNNYLVTGLHK